MKKMGQERKLVKRKTSVTGEKTWSGGPDYVEKNKLLSCRHFLLLFFLTQNAKLPRLGEQFRGKGFPENCGENAGLFRQVAQIT